MTGARTRAVVSRRPAVPADIPLLRSLFADSHLELACLPTDTRFVLVDMQFRAERRQHAAAHPGAQHDVLVVDRAAVGRVMVDRSGDAIRIVDISISLGRRREGIAHAVLSELYAESDRTGRPLRAIVWSGNEAACALLHDFDAVADEDGFITYERAAS